MFLERIEKLLEMNMTERGFKLWKGINSILPNIWDKPTSSTGKHHKKMNGDVPDQAEHVYHLLYSTTKLLRMFNIKKKTSKADSLLFAVVLHDSLKYGSLGTRKFTDNQHDKQAADMIESNRETFLEIMSEEEFRSMEEAVRFHSGRWSTDVSKNKKFDFKDFGIGVFFVHMLDMMSTADLIQTDVRDNDNSFNSDDSSS
jgi:hypothetical protein